MDRLHGTDEAFRRSKSHDRNIVLLGFSSAREMFPDPPKRKQNGLCHQAGGGATTAPAEVSSST